MSESSPRHATNPNHAGPSELVQELTTTALVVEADERERRRQARLLHNVVGQSLTAIGLNLSLITDDVVEGQLDELLERIESTRALVVETARDVRDVMDELRPVVLDDYGLEKGLSWYGQRFSKRTGL